MKFRGWACMALAATIIASVSLTADVQSPLVDEAAATEEIVAPLPPEETEWGRATKKCETQATKPCDQNDATKEESGGVAEIHEAGKNTAHETGGTPILEEGEAGVMGEEPALVEWPPERNPLVQEPEILEPKVIEPLWVRELIDINAGHNDSNPVWSPSGELIAFERSIGDKKEIIIASPVGMILQKVYLQMAGDDDVTESFLPGFFDEASYNSGLSWSPGGNWFVVMSNVGGGNYDLYLGAIGSKETKRLTEHAAKDGLAHWSPVDNHLVFVSGRTGHGDIYLMDLASYALRRLTRGEKAYLHPRWSPDGQKIVMTYGSNDNHDIYLIGDVKRPVTTLKPLTTWPYDDLRPVWSPDGAKIAFYTNYNEQNDPKVWSLAVIAGDGSDPSEGEELAMKVVVTDIIPDVEQGPAWMPDSKRIVYVKNDRHAFNPIYIVDIEKRTNSLLRTGAKMNHDVTCSVNGTIAFRAQVEQWDHIHVARVVDSERRFPSVH